MNEPALFSFVSFMVHNTSVPKHQHNCFTKTIIKAKVYHASVLSGQVRSTLARGVEGRKVINMK